MVLQDVQILVLLVVFLAVERVWFIHMLVREVLSNPHRMDVMIRCKSSHLLSLYSYQFGEQRGWERTKDAKGAQCEVTGAG